MITVSEVESGKGSGDCLPELNYHNSNNAKPCSRIVRSNDTVGKVADTAGDIGTGKQAQLQSQVQCLFLKGPVSCIYSYSDLIF